MDKQRISGNSISGRIILFFILLCFYLLVCSQQEANAIDWTNDTARYEQLVKNVQLAIEDEVYDYKRENLYFEIDGNGGGNKSPAVISMYVSKTISPNGVGIVLYKNMPFGEVYRYFTIKDDLVILSGDPEGPFRNWGNSMLTIYMKTEDVCNFIINQVKKVILLLILWRQHPE
jgi:hypothetical protein